MGSGATHDQLPHVPHQAGWKDVDQAIHAELPNLGEAYQVIAFGKEAGCYDAEETAEKEDCRGFALADFCPMVDDDVDLVARSRGAFVARCWCWRFGRRLVAEHSAA